ncbi:hypothetical protein QJS66_18350 [Kocuria rhizophila]|nr:hypothetical protein QJS66_18350 [Kocuria rhizophila]
MAHELTLRDHAGAGCRRQTDPPSCTAPSTPWTPRPTPGWPELRTLLRILRDSPAPMTPGGRRRSGQRLGPDHRFPARRGPDP